MLIEKLLYPITFYEQISNDPIIFDNYNIVVDYIPGEIWRPINQETIPHVLPIYSISNYGRVYTHHLNRLMNIQILNGYQVVKFKLKTGCYMCCSIHRLLMLVFNYVYNNEELVVNHLDGCKLNNTLDNFEWTTREGNAQHAVKTGLAPTLENHPQAKIDNNTVRYICERLQYGKSARDILNELGMEINKSSLSIIYHIETGRAWKEISKDYKFNISKERYNQKFSDEDVHKVCKMMQDGFSDDQIIDEMGLEKSKYKLTLYNIRSGRKLKRISKEYNIPFKGYKKQK